MVNGDRLDAIVPQEPRHPDMMRALGALIVQRSPADSELLPTGDLPVGHIGDGDAIGSSPARVHLTIGGDRHTHPHPGRLLTATVTSPPMSGCRRHLDPTRHDGCWKTRPRPPSRPAADEYVRSRRRLRWPPWNLTFSTRCHRSRARTLSALQTLLEVDVECAEDIVRSSEPLWNAMERAGVLVDSWGGGEFTVILPRVLEFIRSGSWKAR